MPTMRLPFLYHVEVTRPRRRKPETFIVSDHALFEIPDATSADAPVSLDWRLNDSVLEYPDHYRDKPVPRVVARSWEGRSYLPMYDDAEAGDALAFEASLDDLGNEASRSRGRSSSYRYPSQDGFGHAHDYGRPKGCTVPDLDALLRHVEAKRNRVGNDDRNASMNAALATFRRRLLVVDGTVWTAENVVEPHYVVVDGANGIELRVGMSNDALWYCHAFRADRRDDALAWARRLAEISGRDPAGIKVTTDDIHVPDPSALCLDDGVFTARQMVSCFDTVSGKMGQGSLRDRVKAVEDEVTALRAVAGTVPQGEALSWASQVVDACAEFRAVVADAGLEPGDTRRAFPALDRWEALERERRGDMVELGRFARGAPDQVMVAFTP